MRFQRECGHVDDGNTMMVHENDNDGCTMVQDDDDVHIISHDGGDDDDDGNGHTIIHDRHATSQQTMFHHEYVHTMIHDDDGHAMFHDEEEEEEEEEEEDDDHGGHDVALWLPGYASHMTPLSLGMSSSSRDHHHHHHHHHHHQYGKDYAEKEKSDRLLELQKLYENMSESSYDLSLKDIVDPSYTISGNLKAIVGEDDLNSHLQDKSSNSTGKRRSIFPSSFHRKVSFDFSFCGLRHKKPMRTRPNLSAPKRFLKDHFASKPYLHIQDSRRKHEANCGFTKSKVHPTNECSTCSSYTVFFKCRCLVSSLSSLYFSNQWEIGFF